MPAPSYLGVLTWERYGYASTCVRFFFFFLSFLACFFIERQEAKDDDDVYVVDPRHVFRSDRILVDVWPGQVWIPDYAPLCVQLSTIVYLSIRPYALHSDDPALSEKKQLASPSRDDFRWARPMWSGGGRG